jgi:hypothetical protein
MKSAIVLLLLALLAPMAEAKASSYGKEVSLSFVCYPRRRRSVHRFVFVCKLCVKGMKGKKEMKGMGGKMDMKMTKGIKGKKAKGMKKEKKMKGCMKGKKGGAQPVIFDTDYGPFIDDVFALGVIVNSGDLLDLKDVVTTSVNTDLSSKCVAKHLDLAGRSAIPVLSCAPLPADSERGGVCAFTDFVGFALEEECQDVTLPFEENVVEALAKMLEESGRDDWWYIVVGGQTSLKELVEFYPSAAARIDTVVMMGSNFCDGIEPYPGVFAPIVKTNVACDPAAVNFNLATTAQFKNIYITPVAVADEIESDDYKNICRCGCVRRRPRCGCHS